MNYVDCWAERKVDGIIDGKQIIFELSIEEFFINRCVCQGVAEKRKQSSDCDTVNVCMNDLIIIQIIM